MENLTDRAREILSAVIREYIRTAEPVGSKALSSRYGLGLSPASIRKTLGELEGCGFLYQPHPSAGRVPTERSFRYYIDMLLKIESLQRGDMDLIRSLTTNASNLEQGLREAGKALSALTRSAVMVSAVRNSTFVIKSMRVVGIDRENLMLVAVNKEGTVHTMLVRLSSSDVERINFERITNYLNGIASGLTLRGLKEMVIKEMEDEKNQCDEIAAKALRIGAMALAGDGDGAASEDICYVEGSANLLDQPEFMVDLDKMKRIFNLFEEKSLLVKIIDRCIDDEGLNIMLGSESEVKGLDGLSIVTAPYSAGDGIEGTLGVIGPVWMNYSRIVPLVNYTAMLLGGGTAGAKDINQRH